MNIYLCYSEILGTVYVGYKTSFHALDNKALVFSLARFFQVFQFLITMVAMLYWQRTGRFKAYVSLLHIPQKSAGCIKYKKNLSTIICYLYGIVAITIGFFTLFGLILVLEIDVDIFNPEVIKFFRTYKPLVFVYFIITVYASICTSVCMFLYCIFTYGGVLEVKYFNERLEDIGKKEKSPMVDDMIKLIGDHAKLSEAIRNLDSMCEVTFICCLFSSSNHLGLCFCHDCQYYPDYSIHSSSAAVYQRASLN